LPSPYIGRSHIAIQQPQQAQPILASALAIAARIPVGRDQSNVMHQLAIAYAELRDFDRATQLTEQWLSQTQKASETWLAIAQQYLLAQQPDSALQLRPKLSEIAHQAQLLSATAAYYVRQDQLQTATPLFQQALQVIRSHPRWSGAEKEWELGQVLTRYAQTGQADAVRAELQSLTQNRDAKDAVLAALVTAYHQANRPQDVSAMLSARLEQIRGNTDSSWQQFELQNLLQQATQVQQFDWIAHQWQVISSLGNPWFAVALATTYAQTGEYRSVLKWVDQIDDQRYPLLEIELLTAIARQAHQDQQPKWATKLLRRAEQRTVKRARALEKRFAQEGGDQLLRDGFRPRAYARIASIYGLMGHTAQMNRLLDRVIELDRQTGDPQLAQPSDSPIAILTEAKQYTGALRIALSIDNLEIREQHLQTVAAGLLEQNNLALALSVVEQLKNPAVKTLLLIAAAQRPQVPSEKALLLLAQATALAQSVPGEESQFDYLGREGDTVIPMENDRGSLLEAIALQYARIGQFERAYAVARRLQEQSYRASVEHNITCLRR
jgi:hypothetical protein